MTPNFAPHYKDSTPFLWLKLIFISVIIGLCSSVFGITLKHFTEKAEHYFFELNKGNFVMISLTLIAGLTLIYLFRKYAFQNKVNKGIPEVLEAASSHKKIPFYKIPSHYINGFLTLISGGSTGIEVSTVVSSGSIGGYATNKHLKFRHYNKEFIGAGVAAGITALFINPLAGLLFSYEIVVKKPSKVFFVTHFVSIGIASTVNILLQQKPLFHAAILDWQIHAIPYLIGFSVIAVLYAIFLTISVGYLKKLFTKINGPYLRLLICALLVSVCITFIPELYGDGYHSIQENLAVANAMPFSSALILQLVVLLLFKPFASALTLAAGGDGGVFAPALFGGAFLGLLVALVCNTFFNAHLIPVNFMVFGIALVLSASMHAPFTALFIVCGMFGSYTLFAPLLVLCIAVKYLSKYIYPHSMYHLDIVPNK